MTRQGTARAERWAWSLASTCSVHTDTAQATPASLDVPPHTMGRSASKIYNWNLRNPSGKCKKDGRERIISQLYLKICPKKKFHFQEGQTKSRSSLAGSSPLPALGASRRPVCPAATSWSPVRATRTSWGRWAAAHSASTWSWGLQASSRLAGWVWSWNAICVDDEMFVNN